MRTFRNLSLLCIVLSAAGCVGSPDAVDGASSDLVRVDANTVPLPAVADDDWMSAPAGCEGLLEGIIHFKVASARDGLVVAVEPDGDIRCVDTVGSVQEELEETGHDTEAAELAERFLVAAFPRRSSYTAGDPTPQPNSQPVLGGERRDPTPQPNVNP